MQNLSRSHAWKLIHISHQDQSRPMQDRFQQRLQQKQVHHGHLVHYDHIRLQRLRNMFVHPGILRRLHILRKCIGRHGHNRNLRSIRSAHAADGLRRLISVHHRHHYIHKNNLISLRLSLFKDFHRFFPVVRYGNVHAEVF